MRAACERGLAAVRASGVQCPLRPSRATGVLQSRRGRRDGRDAGRQDTRCATRLVCLYPARGGRPGRRTAPRLVVFDVDGTLVDSQHLILAAMTEAFAAVGAPVPAREAVLGSSACRCPRRWRRWCRTCRREADDRWPTLPERFVSQRPHGGARRTRRFIPGASTPSTAWRRARTRCSGWPPARRRSGLDHVLEHPRPRSFFVTLQTADATLRSRIPRCCSRHLPRPASRPAPR